MFVFGVFLGFLSSNSLSLHSLSFASSLFLSCRHVDGPIMHIVHFFVAVPRLKEDTVLSEKHGWGCVGRAGTECRARQRDENDIQAAGDLHAHAL